MENTTETAPAKPEQNEIATTRDGRDITRGFVDGLPLLPTTDKLLMLKGAGDLRIYQEVMRDEQVKACFEQRVRAVVSRPWEVKPGGTKLIDKKAAEFIDEQCKAIKFDSITEKMLYGVFYGYGVGEALYAVQDGKVVLDTSRGGIKVRDRRRFGFAPDMSLRLKTSSNPMGEVLPEKKFWHFATGSDHDDEPYGLGLAHWLYWPVFFKRSGVKFWLVFLEKFGMPTAVGKYQSGASLPDQNKLLEALGAIQTDSAIIIPEGMTAELLEATRGGTADYTALYDRMDAAIARATLGQTASTQGTPGKLGNDELQGDVRDDIVKADADLVCMSFNATVVKWLVEWNFPGAALPQVWRKCEDEEDANTTAERDGKIAQMGFKPTLKYIHEAYGGEWVEAIPPSPPFAKGGAQGADEIDFANPYHGADGRFTGPGGANFVSIWGKDQAKQHAASAEPKVKDGHHTLSSPMSIVRETEKAVAVENAALMEARATAGYDIKELSSSQIQMLRDNRGGSYVWLPKSQISTHDGKVIGMPRWLADKQGFATKESLAAKEKAFSAGKQRYESLLAQAKAGGVKGVRVGMRTTTIKEKMRAAGMPVEFADDDEGLDIMARIEFADGDTSATLADRIDDLVDVALAEWQADLAPAAEAIQALMDESAAKGETAAQFLERLPGLLKEGGPLALDGKLTQAAFVARLAGEAGIPSADDGR